MPWLTFRFDPAAKLIAFWKPGCLNGAGLSLSSASSPTAV
jgi:hypothetical protein